MYFDIQNYSLYYFTLKVFVLSLRSGRLFYCSFVQFILNNEQKNNQWLLWLIVSLPFIEFEMDYVIGLFACCIAAGCFWFGFKMIRIYLKVSKWDRIEATIVSKKVELRKKYSTSRTVAYAPIIQYKYAYKGVHFMGSHVHIEELAGGFRGYRKNAAEKFIDQLGEKTMIYVNPQKPTESVMYCKGVGISFILIGAGLLALLVGCMYVL